MLPPPHARTFALAASCALLFGCAQASPPSAGVEELPADAVLDVPENGLVEPRVQIFNAIGGVAPPALSVTARSRFFPQDVESVIEVREVLLTAEIVGAAKQGELTMELIQPGGSAYEVRTARIGGDANAKYRVDFVLPVAATSIDRANLTGRWSAHFLLDGAEVARTDFRLNAR